MLPRFHIAHAPESEWILLDESESHHLIRVRRIPQGATIVLFDGSGWEYEAEVAELAHRQVRLRIMASARKSRESSSPLTLGVALPKGDRQRLLIEKCVELGVAHLVPLSTRRSVVEAGPSQLARWSRYVIEASKQCGRNHLMTVVPPTSTKAFLESAPTEAVRWFFHPSGANSIRAIPPTEGGSVIAAIGPEGGWHDDEVSCAESHGWPTVALGRPILRTETAAIAVAAWCALVAEGACASNEPPHRSSPNE